MKLASYNLVFCNSLMGGIKWITTKMRLISSIRKPVNPARVSQTARDRNVVQIELVPIKPHPFPDLKTEHRRKDRKPGSGSIRRA
uniref:Uncharacterized protein n=1 Tax=Anopheles atroparvus TaxID=41427 RepID=A0AAG5D2T4_ANOAO